MYTGNSSEVKCETYLTAVYPCVYRELEVLTPKTSRICGLSLCIQGTPPIGFVASAISRFIPVYTGNSLKPLTIESNKPVYPCVYRELTNQRVIFLDKGGLSLCIQGTLRDSFILNCRFRFIPVYTGNSDFVIASMLVLTVYPCVYRELGVNLSIVFFPLGLSLCIQGTRDIPPNIVIWPRFIPVYTGNSLVKIMALNCKSVYPCVYREL